MKNKSFIASFVAMFIVALVAMPALGENIVRWGVKGDAQTFDPQSYNSASTQTYLQHTYEPLIEKDPNLNFIPCLATEWKSLDENTWEFKLRKGVKFHDGSPFTSEDVVFSINRAKAQTSNFKNYVRAIAEVIAKDDFTVEIKTNGPNPILPNELSIVYIMDKDWCEKHEVVEPQDKKKNEETYTVRHGNGTGAFKLELREIDIKTIFVKNQDWWGLKEKSHHNIDKIIITPITSDATRVAALLSGEVDFISDAPLQDLSRIQKNQGTHVTQAMEVRTIFYVLDTQSPELRSCTVKGKNPFADKRVRQAIYQAIDIEAIKKKIMRGTSIPAGMLVPPGVFGYSKEQGERLPYDPEASKKLLAEAGYPDGFGITMDVPNNRYVNDEAVGQATVGMLAKVGIKVRLDAQPKTQHFQKVRKGETDFFLMGWGNQTVDSGLVQVTWGEPSGWNVGKYINPAIPPLNKKIAVEMDTKKRFELIKQVWQIMIDDVAYLPLHYQMISVGVSDILDIPITPTNQPHMRFARFK